MKKIILGLLSLLIILSSNAQVAINTDGSPADASAMLDVKSTNMGFLMPRLSNTQRNSISNPIEGLMVYSTTDKCVEFFDGSDWVSFCGGSTNTVTGYNGIIWNDNNLGASQTPANKDDSNGYGDLYQWGRGTDGHEKRNSSTTTTMSSLDSPGHGDFIIVPDNNRDWRDPQNVNLWQGVSGINNPCSSGFRVPTATELDDERNAWVTNNAEGAYQSTLKFTKAGSRKYDTGAIATGRGLYSSSTIYSTYRKVLEIIDGSSTNNGKISYYYRASGISVRCIKD